MSRTLEEKRDDARALYFSAKLDAIKSVRGILSQEGFNASQKYAYVGHAQVLMHVRDQMAEHGLSVEPPFDSSYEVVNFQSKNGPKSMLRWKIHLAVSFFDEEESCHHVEPYVVEVNTGTSDKAASAASTAADRTLMLRLMRLGGVDADIEDIYPSDNDGTGGASRGEGSGAGLGDEDSDYAVATDHLMDIGRRLNDDSDDPSIAADLEFWTANALTFKGDERAKLGALLRRCCEKHGIDSDAMIARVRRQK